MGATFVPIDGDSSDICANCGRLFDAHAEADDHGSLTCPLPPSTRPCGTCLTAEFADEDSEDSVTLLVPPGRQIGHLRRPAGSSQSSALGLFVSVARGSGPYTYCGRPIGGDWTEVARG